MAEFSTLDSEFEQAKSYENFPEEGVTFLDLSKVLLSKEAMEQFAFQYNAFSGDMTVFPEARGFFMAPFFNNPVLARKKGKLPRSADETILSVSYKKEYGEDTLEIRMNDIRSCVPQMGNVLQVVLCDDILATGGTMEALYSLLNSYTFYHSDGREITLKVKGFLFLAGIEGLGGIERLEKLAPVMLYKLYSPTSLKLMATNSTL